MVRVLWAPWRLEYVSQIGSQSDCVFCGEAAGTPSAQESLILREAHATLAILNKYPYSSGHFMVAPRRHIGTLTGLTDDEVLETHRLAVEGLRALGYVYRAEGFNVGWNLGHVAGAGIAEHVHMHVVPRWPGDTNFMPVLADAKILPEHLLETRDRLREAWSV